MAGELHSTKKHQRRICQYLGLTCTHRTIFCLPRAIRFRIYYEAGLVHEGDINLNGRPDADTWPSAADRAFENSLFLSCPAIYTEASSAVYSTNRFFIRYRDTRSLQLLRNLTPHSLSLLTHLTVHLNVSSCEKGNPCCKAYPVRPKCCDSHDKPLRLSPSSRHPILSEWRSTVECIKAHLKPSRLHLHLLCDVVDIETARQAAFPLLSIPTLASCAIRLSRTPDPLIRQLARTTAMRVMAHPSYQPEYPFRMLDLPRELRRLIFELTDLVTPLRETEWSPLEGFKLRYSNWRCGGVGDCAPYLHHACQFRNCWEDSNDGCFCGHVHAAFTSRCHCWSPPTSLFLVCRALQEDARAVFFMRNRFIINHSQDSVKHAPLRVETSIFLTDIVPLSALHFLRYLELVFPIVDDDYLCHEPPYQDWIRTIDLVKEELCLPLLTVRIYITDYLSKGRYLPTEASSSLYSQYRSEQYAMIFQTFSRTLRPLSKLKELKAFFVHLEWPTAKYFNYLIPDVKERTQVFEQDLERLVMGSDYSNMTLQKEQSMKSQWWEAFLKLFEQA